MLPVISTTPDEVIYVLCWSCPTYMSVESRYSALSPFNLYCLVPITLNISADIVPLELISPEAVTGPLNSISLVPPLPILTGKSA